MSDLHRRVAWALHEVETAALRRTHPLRYLFLEVTRRCNLACAYCGSGCTPKAQAEELEAADWIRLIREIAEDFHSPDVMMAVTGGEPLLKEGIFDLFAELRRLGFPFGMVCNGQLLDRDAARRLVEVRMGSLSLSLDAPPDLNDQLRGRGAAEKVAAAVGHLHDAGYAGKLEIMTTVTAPVVARLEEMRRYVAELRVPMWRLVPVMPIGRAAQRPELVPSGQQLRELLEFAVRARSDGRLPRPEVSEEGFLGREFEGRARSLLWHCEAGLTIGGIRSDGRIGACPELGEAFLQGDARRERFSKVWESRYELFRDRSWTRKGRCASCKEYRRCRGGSLHLYGSPAAEPLRCLYLDAIAPPAGRS